ncbi:altered inheritance of mitochondria protein 21 domain-containing protein [Hirsutella rhossiliensis]|uniref:Altered inheritance of mitochondria protein 21 domain-containing protein n=1 Tax=Hirsutella rhossiliensis TaxID=111463 RepID=A0A9P8MNJ1_9HYPO|nr:altered inheritance of mitochondria protein 21 domain-containing protein [Hirsutella rhossiliensis]KAH0958703.1 altered inheritance of mitochondria protein 21 domain-containing protein [Hirsutella rhossiliensis]
MSAAATQQTPAVPPRPSRTMDKEGTGTMPKIPPRPAHKHIDRSVSPNPDRFAPSPLSGGVTVKPANRAQLLGPRERADEAIDRSGSVPMPSVGEEGVEYSAVADEMNYEERRSSSPEQTRTVGEDLKLHAPKPSLPAASAKQQVMAVTRTDSDRAASFGIGRPGSTAGERSASRNSNRKRPGSSYSAHSDHHTDDEQGIPEIGQRVPMNPHLGDVQAPSPGPGATSEGANKRHHGRKLSARGLPPGSYGLHGHGVAPQDKLDKAYYQKHPEVLEREQHTPLHDRQNDFAMSSSDLNKLVRDTASRQSAPGNAELRGTPTEEVAFQASEEYTSRISSSRPASAAPSQKAAAHADATSPDAEMPIHVDDARHPELYSCGDEDNVVAEEEHEYSAPILAPDQVSKDPSAQLQHPAIHPHQERRDSLEAEEPSSRPTSRSGHNRAPSYQRPEFGSTPLEDVEEYEPLFSEEIKEEKQKQEPADENQLRHHFPSRDVWEDAPSSVHYTAEVSTPEQPEQVMRRPSTQHEDRPITPAQAFAQYQEQLAEKEATGRTNSLPLSEEKPTWISHQPHLSPKKVGRPPLAHRFPSRDIWEETPESQLQEAVVSASPTEGDNPDSAARLTKKPSDPSESPAVPDRPRPRQSSGDNSAKPRPPVSDKPKPNIPPRPTKTSPGDPRDTSVSKSKPAVPSRPVGSKIAALQAGFMSDLNKRLQLGPQAPKKEETAEDEVGEEKEKAPLSDARKGRARGPQRRAPAAKTPAAAATSSAVQAPVIALTLSIPQTSWSLDPDDGDIAVGTENEATPDTSTEAEECPEPAHVDGAQVSGGSRSQPVLVEEPQTIDLSHGTTKVEQGGERETLTQSSHAEGEKNAESKAKEEPVMEEKTLVANMAGESVLETTVEKAKDGNEVEPVEVHDDVKA